MSEQAEAGRAEEESRNLPATYWESVRRRRQLVRASQKDVAFAAAVSRGTLINVEKGPGGPVPEPATVVAIMAALGCAAIEDGGDVQFGEIFTPQVAARAVEVIGEIRAGDELRAKLAAQSYRNYIAAWSLISHRTDGRPDPEPLTQALREALPPLQTFLVPHLRAGQPTDDVLLQRFDLDEFERQHGEEAKAAIHRETEQAMFEYRRLPDDVKAVTPFSSYKPTWEVTPPEDEVDALRRRLAEADERRRLAERHALEMRQRAEQAEAALAATQARTDSVRAFERLPEDVQELLRTGHLHDWKVFAGRGMRHVRLTVQEEGAAPVTARDVMEQAAWVDFALIGSMMFIRSLQNHNWDYQRAVNELPSMLQDLTSQVREAVSWLENPQNAAPPEEV
jgi:DNA-binding XRE family transcriptional regulator